MDEQKDQVKGADGLPALPSGWLWVPLGEIADITGGVTKGQKRNQTANVRQVPYLRVANVQRGYLDLEEMKTIEATAQDIEELRLKKGDVLFNEGGDRDKLGRGWVWNEEIEECIHQNHVFRARLPLSDIEPKFVSFHGNSFGQHWFMRTGKQSVNLASINLTVLKAFPVPLPPVAEQRRIVARIEELFSQIDAGVAALKRVQVALKRYRAAVLKAAVEGKLTEGWRAAHPDSEPASALLQRILVERRRLWEEEQQRKYTASSKEPPKGWKEKYAEPEGPDVSQLPPLPPGWCWSSIGQCFTVSVGATPSRTKPEYWGGSIPWVSSGQVQFCRIKEPAEWITDLGLQHSNTKLNLVGSVLLGMIGEGRTRGQVAILDIPACNNQNCAAIWVTETPILSTYVYYWLWSQYEVTRRRGSGNNQPALNKQRVEAITLPLPPLHEQLKIVDEVEEILSKIAATENSIERSLRCAVRLRRSILKMAFEGRLVPQVPSDEPAEALVGRIRQQRAERNGDEPRRERKARRRATTGEGETE